MTGQTCRRVQRRGCWVLIRDEHGTALLAALGIAALLLPLGAFVVLRIRTHMLIQYNLRRDLEAFYAAEAGIEETVARIRPGTVFDDVLDGPDGMSGTADDGTALVPSTDAAMSVTTTFRPQVRAVPDTAGRLRIVSTALGAQGPTKVIEALVERAPRPFTPAAFHLEGDLTGLRLGGEPIVLSGLDHDITDVPGTPSGPAPPVPAVSTSVPDAEPLLRDGLVASPVQVSGPEGSSGLVVANALDLSALVGTASGRPESIMYPSLIADTSLVLGTAAAPQLSIISGDCEVTGQLSGSGIVVVGGLLHVGGTLAVSGLLVAMGGVVFDAGSRVEIRGAFWRGAGSDARLELRGTGAFVYSSVALESAEAMAPGLLPHAAVVVGWREQL